MDSHESSRDPFWVFSTRSRISLEHLVQRASGTRKSTYRWCMRKNRHRRLTENRDSTPRVWFQYRCESLYVRLGASRQPECRGTSVRRMSGGESDVRGMRSAVMGVPAGKWLSLRLLEITLRHI